MAPPHACGTGVGTDEFVVMLRHLADVAAAGSSLRSRGARLLPRGSQPDTLATGRIRLLLARVECAAQSLQDMINSASVLLCLGALRFTLRVVMIQHAAPCLRCGRARQGLQVDRLVAFHWSLANLIVQLQGLRQEKTLRHRAVFEFLSRHRISSALSIRVRRHVDRSQPQQVRDSNVDSLRRLSTELMVDLLEEMRVPALSAHPFFINLRTKHPHLVRELCHEALQPMLKSPDEIVFCAGEACSRMYVIVSGHALYSASVQPRDAAVGAGPAQVRRTLHGGQWLSEAALWTGWVHRGELRVVTDCLLFALDASGFARVISSHKLAHQFAAAYARKFVEGLNRGLQTDLVEAGPVDQ
mmetsp:Transcript_18993/g.60294  ORF Transcript_18993/g.60294 Transcript_18993/m.60294 type:complete len:357 (-) Transcript_18993:62-1132(-)